MGFSKDFVWGAATSSYQIEGAAYEDGKGLSVWDTFCKQPGKVFQGHSGDIACDHYHYYQKDVQLMQEIGLKAYRFSVSWPRVLPDGIGAVNEKGLDFYDRLVEELLKAGIDPYLTLFHWDYPLALFHKGGWMNPDSPKWFMEYAQGLAKRLGDRVKHIFTFNEPQCFIGLGYVTGRHAPGYQATLFDTIPMAHHVMMAHGLAARAFKQVSADIQVGYAPTFGFWYPAEDTPENREAARRANETLNTGENWAWDWTWWSDPVFLGSYPEEKLAVYEPYLPQGWEKDLETIHAPVDFQGQNIYNGTAVRAAENGDPVEVEQPMGAPHTAIGWKITPEVLEWAPQIMFERYGLPIYITENGCSCNDIISLDGNCHDPERVDFMHRYLLALRKSAQKVPLKGYFAWSLMDNFEWAEGYKERFGMIYVDYATQKRTIKDSGYWYRDVIASNGEIL